MKLNCVYCGKLFSISAEQLGGQGKCPHCQEVVFLPKADDNASLPPSTAWRASTSWQYLIAVLAAIVLHLLLMVALGLTVWGGNDAPYSFEGTRIKIGRPPQSARASSASPAPSSESVASATTVPVERLDRAVNEVKLSALNQLDLPSANASNAAQSSDWSALMTGAESFEANLNEDFGALLERLKRDGLDLVITFDSTGSMTGEINQVKQQITRIGRILLEMIPQTRISICTYRDEGDAYIVKGLPLTRNLEQIQWYLNEISAGGGGDEPEAVVQGLRWSIEENRFNPNARKVILLFGDAPPHDASLPQCMKLAAEFNQRVGGIISTVTCRSPQRLGSFTQIAQFGGGEAFLTQDEREIVSQLVVLVFGSQHQEKVLEAFKMLNR